MNKAFLITAERQTIEAVEVDGRADLEGLIGYPTLESDTVDSDGDQLFFDEECFIRGTSGRFQIDKLIPVAGRGVVVGVAADGETLADVAITLDALRGRTRFL